MNKVQSVGEIRNLLTQYHDVSDCKVSTDENDRRYTTPPSIMCLITDCHERMTHAEQLIDDLLGKECEIDLIEKKMARGVIDEAEFELSRLRARLGSHEARLVELCSRLGSITDRSHV